MLLILDIDFTLNNFYSPSIRHLLPAELTAQDGPRLWDWIVEHLSTVDYPVRKEAVEVLHYLTPCAPLVVVSTGRPEALRAVTERWLRQFLHFERLFMRRAGDFRPNAEVKRDHLTRSIFPLGKGRALYAFEDDVGALAMYEESGVQTFAAPDCWTRLQTQLWGEVDPATIRTILATLPQLKNHEDGAG